MPSVSATSGGMMDERRSRELETALSLMRLALPLLDRAGEVGAAARLQHAIDLVDGEPVGVPGRAV